MNTQVLSLQRQGASHIKKGLVCQDNAGSRQLDDGTILLALSDGHGSRPHFRSDRGSHIAVETALEVLEEFAGHFNVCMLPGVGCTTLQQGTLAEFPNPQSPEADNIFRHMGAAILYRWERKVVKDWLENKLKEDERALLKPDELAELEKGVRHKILRTYGCTLQAAIRTDSYWLALHLGDGKIVAARKDGSIYEPVPWDKDCFQNITTSICDISAAEFRYCYSVDSDEASALFLASDGMDDSFPTAQDLYSCYGINFLGRINYNGWDYFSQNVDKLLDRYSQYYSGDDMSLACWIDLDAIGGMMRRILNHKRALCLKKIDSVENQLRKLAEQKTQLERQQCEIERHKSVNASVKSFFELILGRLKNSPDDITSEITNTLDGVKKDNARNEENIRQRDTELMRIGIEIKTRVEGIEKLQRSLDSLKRELASVEDYISKLDDNT